MRRIGTTIPAVMLMLSLIGLFIGWNLTAGTGAPAGATLTPTVEATVEATAEPTATAMAVIDAEATADAIFAADAAAISAQLTAVALQLATAEAQLTALAATNRPAPQATAIPQPPTVTAAPAVPTATPEPVAPTAEPPPATLPPATAAPSPALIDGERARQAAAQYLGSTETPSAVTLMTSNGRPAFEVTFARGAVYIDAVTGAVIGSSIPATATPAPAGISARRAGEIAAAYYGRSRVVEISRTVERGADVFEVAFADGSEVYVDAVRGTVVYADINTTPDDDDADDEDDDRDEDEDDDEDDDEDR